MHGAMEALSLIPTEASDVGLDVDLMFVPVRAYSHVVSVNLFLKIQTLQNGHFHSACMLGGGSQPPIFPQHRTPTGISTCMWQ
jgi:hypothetical protein